MVWLTVALALIWYLVRSLARDKVTTTNARRKARMEGIMVGSYRYKVMVYRYFHHTDGINWQD